MSIILKLIQTIAIVCFLSGAQMAVAEDKEAESKLGEVTSTIDKLTNWLKGAEGRRKDLEKDLKKSELEISAIGRRLHSLKIKQNQTKERIKSLQKKSEELALSLQSQKATLREQLKATYQMGNTPAIKALLSAEDPHQLARMTAYMDKINQARNEKLQAFNALLVDVQENKQEIALQKERLNQQLTSLKKDQSKQESLKKKRSRTLASLNKEMGKSSARLAQLKQDRIKLESVIKAAREAAKQQKNANSTPFSKLKKKLPWPANGKVIKAYRGLIGNSSLRSNGITIKTSYGQPVKAIHHGQIVFSDWLRGFGLMIIIDHGNGYMSLYGQNDSLIKDTGDWVNSGDLIASSGNSGGAQQSSLYFEIRKNGKPQNPLKWLGKRK